MNETPYFVPRTSYLVLRTSYFVPRTSYLVLRTSYFVLRTLFLYLIQDTSLLHHFRFFLLFNLCPATINVAEIMNALSFQQR